MNNLVIDIGNTLAKFGVFKNGVVHSTTSVSSDNIEAELSDLTSTYCFDYVIVSSVKNLEIDIRQWIRPAGLMVFDYQTHLPIKNDYATPETLGLDRLAGVVGAWEMFPKSNSLVIDCGTCLKFDFLNAKGHYLGGNISLGLKMRFSALNHYTDKLPLLQNKPISEIYGISTESAIHTGVVQGATEEIKGTMQLFEQKFGKINTIITGGDASVFEKRLKVPIFALPNLVLNGLHTILEFNI